MKRTFLSNFVFSTLLFLGITGSASAQAADPFLGQIAVVGFNFCPTGWAETNGQLISISSNTALFSLLGTTYGGDGRTTFALPDLRGRVVIGDGNGAGLTPHVEGESSGTETNTLTVGQIPAHSHTLSASTAAASKTDPTGSFLAASGEYRKNATAPANLAATSVGTTGGGQPVNNMQPYLVMKVCIAVTGVFPSRN